MADTLDEVLATLEPEIVLLTIGVNDIFTASAYLDQVNGENNSPALGGIWSRVRQHSRLYKLVYMARQGVAAGQSNPSPQAAIPNYVDRDILDWEDDPEQRMKEAYDFVRNNTDAAGEAAKSDDSIVSKSAAIEVIFNIPADTSERESGFQYVAHNVTSIRQRAEDSGATFYLLNYAASASYYQPVNAAIRRYADKNPQIRFIDIEQELLKTCPISVECPDLFFKDFHPKPPGYEKVATKVLGTLEKDFPSSH